MKKFVLLLALIVPCLLSAQQKEIQWISIEEAQKLVKKEPRKIMMDVYTHWCGPCKMMMANTFSNPDVIDYVNKNYYAVKFDAESPDAISFKGEAFDNPDYDPNRKGRNGVHKFSRYMRVNAYPTIVYMDEECNFLTSDAGYKTPKQIELMLRFFVEDRYKDVKTQEEWSAYQNNFVPAFKE
jgi:thioredoxin-related protein